MTGGYRAPIWRSESRDRGSLALELSICAPVLILMLLGVVALGRGTHGRQLVQDAAAAAARTASLAYTGPQAEQVAVESARDSLTDAGLACQGQEVSVDTSAFRAGGQVTVTVRCHSDLSQLSLTGLPGQIRLNATSTAPIDPFREVGES